MSRLFYFYSIYEGLHVVLPHSRKVPALNLFVWSLHVLSIHVLVLSWYVHKRACVVDWGDSKLTLGVSVSVCVVVCLCVAL